MVHPGTAEEITINLLHYYISNIRFAKADGSQYVQPDSYHLVRLNDGSLAELVLTNVPVGAYIDIRYTIGVDAARNLGGTQEGALDPANGMFWDWNTGYIFVKVEGNSPQAVDDAFQYHLGGFSGTANAIRTNTHSFGGTPLQLVKNAEPSIHISVNAARFWHGGLRLADLNFVHAPSSQAATIATNFSNGFLLDRIQN